MARPTAPKNEPSDPAIIALLDASGRMMARVAKEVSSMPPDATEPEIAAKIRSVQFDELIATIADLAKRLAAATGRQVRPTRGKKP